MNHSNLRLFCERWTWNAQESRERRLDFSLSSWVLFPVNEKTYKNLLYPSSDAICIRFFLYSPSSLFPFLIHSELS